MSIQAADNVQWGQGGVTWEGRDNLAERAGGQGTETQASDLQGKAQAKLDAHGLLRLQSTKAPGAEP